MTGPATDPVTAPSTVPSTVPITAPITVVRRGAKRLWRQLPFLVWLILLWMLLWGQFTPLSLLTGVIAAVFVVSVFQLPPVELSGRINLWYAAVFAVRLLVELVHGSLTVAWQVLDWRSQPGAAIIAVPLVTDDDFIMTSTAIAATLIPGSLVVEADPDRRVLYLHVLGVRSDDDVRRQRESVLGWERALVLAVGSRAQAAMMRAGTGREKGARR